MELSEYQSLSRRTATYPRAGEDMTYPALGLCGEAGEVAEKVKKTLRDDGGVLTDERREALSRELGDVLWYLSQLATEADLDLETIAEENLDRYQSTSPSSRDSASRRSSVSTPPSSRSVFFTFSATSPASPHRPSAG